MARLEGDTPDCIDASRSNLHHTAHALSNRTKPPPVMGDTVIMRTTKSATNFNTGAKRFRVVKESGGRFTCEQLREGTVTPQTKSLISRLSISPPLVVLEPASAFDPDRRSGNTAMFLSSR